MNDSSIFGWQEEIQNKDSQRHEEPHCHRQHRRKGEKRILEAAMADTPEERDRRRERGMHALSLLHAGRTTFAAQRPGIRSSHIGCLRLRFRRLNLSAPCTTPPPTPSGSETAPGTPCS